MPYDESGAVAEPSIDEAEAQSRDATVANVGAEAPPVSGGVSGALVDRLGKALSTAVESLTGGEAQAPIDDVDPAAALDRLPPTHYTALVALSKLTEKLVGAGIETAGQYQFDPAELAGSTEGIQHAVSIVQGMGTDRALIRDMRQPLTASKPPAPADTGKADRAAKLAQMTGRA
jgi:hypothetical protein